MPLWLNISCQAAKRKNGPKDLRRNMPNEAIPAIKRSSMPQLRKIADSRHCLTTRF